MDVVKFIDAHGGKLAPRDPQVRPPTAAACDSSAATVATTPPASPTSHAPWPSSVSVYVSDRRRRALASSVTAASSGSNRGGVVEVQYNELTMGRLRDAVLRAVSRQAE
jgi:hypothetical protein